MIDNLIETAVAWIKKLTEAGIAVIALAIVAQVIFGDGVAFLPGDVIGRITGILDALGENGLVGLIALGVLYVLFKNRLEA